jgi:site-specific DNA-methyltransferase (cytosine-N4-specific)
MNLGDGYNAQPNQRKVTDKAGTKQSSDEGSVGAPSRSVVGLKPKDLIGMPWRMAFALQEDGWWLRQDIIWSKPNPMPESVTDRCTKAHEYLFLLTKSARYFYDQEAISELCSPATHARLAQNVEAQIGSERAHAGGKTNGNMKAVGRSSWNGLQFHDGKNALIHPNVGKNRKMAETGSGTKNNDSFNAACCLLVERRNKRSVWEVATEPFSEAHFATFPTKLVEPCIRAGCPPGGTILDPFNGSGTTGLVALAERCNYIGIELNPEYVAMSERRLEAATAQGILQLV